MGRKFPFPEQESFTTRVVRRPASLAGGRRLRPSSRFAISPWIKPLRAQGFTTPRLLYNLSSLPIARKKVNGELLNSKNHNPARFAKPVSLDKKRAERSFFAVEQNKTLESRTMQSSRVYNECRADLALLRPVRVTVEQVIELPASLDIVEEAFIVPMEPGDFLPFYFKIPEMLV